MLLLLLLFLLLLPLLLLLLPTPRTDLTNRTEEQQSSEGGPSAVPHHGDALRVAPELADVLLQGRKGIEAGILGVSHCTGEMYKSRDRSIFTALFLRRMQPGYLKVGYQFYTALHCTAQKIIVSVQCTHYTGQVDICTVQCAQFPIHSTLCTVLSTPVLMH